MNETNLLSLIRPWLNTNYQIPTKVLPLYFAKKNCQLNGLGAALQAAGTGACTPVTSAALYSCMHADLDHWKVHYIKKRFSVTLNLQYMYEVLNVDKIKN
jgi:hypothetical protein